MHYFSTVNLGIISEFTPMATAGIFLLPSHLFIPINVQCGVQSSQTKQDHQHVLVHTLGTAYTVSCTAVPLVLFFYFLFCS